MKVFKISEKQIKMEKKKILIYAVPIILVSLIVGLFIGIAGSGYKDIFLILPVLIVLTAAGVIIGIVYGNKINNDSLSSYKIELLDNSIKKYQKNISVIEIERSEVISITEVVNKGITIKTNNKNQYIYVPVFVEGYSELKESLSQWMNITLSEKNNSQFLKTILNVGVILGIAVTMLCEYSYIVIPVGIVMIIVLLWSFVMILKNPQLDPKIKKNSFVIILPLIVIVIKVLSFIL